MEEGLSDWDEGRRLDVRLQLRERHEITAYPLLPGSGKARLVIPALEGSDAFVHRRTIGGRDIEVFTKASAFPNPHPSLSINDTVIYGGPIFHHFGHFVAESIHRIWPRWLYPKLANSRVAFHCPPKRDTYVTLVPQWMENIFEYLGLPVSRILMIDRPMRFQTLLFPEQGRWLSSAAADPRYVDLFPCGGMRVERFSASEAATKRVYVSRREYLHSGSYLGETLVEKILGVAGFRIVYPEREHIADLVKILSEADQIIFSEGSAIHAIELCGNIRAKVLVICRRPEWFVRSTFVPLLTELCSSYEFYFAESQVTPLDWDQNKNRPAWGNASSRLDLLALLTCIKNFSGAELRLPKASEAATAMQLDLLRIILDKRSTKAGTTPEALLTLLSALRDQAPKLGLVPES